MENPPFVVCFPRETVGFPSMWKLLLDIMFFSKMRMVGHTKMIVDSVDMWQTPGFEQKEIPSGKLT